MSPVWWRFVLGWRRHLGEMLLASLLINGFALALPLFSMLVYDKAMGNEVHDTLWALAGGMAILFVLELALRMSRVFIVEHAGARWDAHLDERLMRGVLAAPLSRALPAGEVMARYRQVASTRDVLGAQCLLALADLPFLGLYVVAVAAIGGPLVALPIVIGLLLLGFTAATHGIAQQRQRQAEVAHGEKFGELMDVLAARESLVAPAAASVALQRYRAPAQRGARSAAQARLWLQFAQQATPVAMAFCTVSLLVAGVFRVEAQALSVGGLISVNLLGGRMLGILCGIAPVVLRWREFQRALRELDRTIDLDVPPPAAWQVARDADSTSRGAFFTEGLRLDGVGFTYPGHTRPTLDALTLHLRPGEVIALVGASGSGKSTLLRLLAGQMAPGAGRLAYAGHAIDSEAARRWLGAQARFKPQDPSFLRGRVAEIVAPGITRPDEAALVAALRGAGLGAALDRGELGLNTEVGTNGAGLSGGQRQSLALARAFHTEPGYAVSNELLLLDEPTLGLDRTSQDQVLRSLEAMREGRCIVIATHAAEVIQCADRVLVLDRGRLVADAPPARLLGARPQSAPQAEESAP